MIRGICSRGPPPPGENVALGSAGVGMPVTPYPTAPAPTTGGLSRPNELTLLKEEPPRPDTGATDPKLAPVFPLGQPCTGGITNRYWIVMSAGISLGTAVTASSCPSAHPARLTTDGSFEPSAWTNAAITVGSFRLTRA